jgi:ubiquinone/menaquinone biosynthesis C-methylase UbiE
VPDYAAIYETRADDYDRMVAREDHEGNILRAIESVFPLADADVVDFGAGTGRLTTLLAPQVRFISAFDTSAHMLDRARANLERLRGLDNWRLAVADHRSIPVPSRSADLAVAGWTVHSVSDDSAELSAALAEMERILCPGGATIILETLGTGHTEPLPPPGLIPFYDYLKDHGFANKAFRTDYRFASVAEAEELTRFFFGDELADRIVREQMTTVPEGTGPWWRNLKPEA